MNERVRGGREGGREFVCVCLCLSVVYAIMWCLPPPSINAMDFLGRLTPQAFKSDILLKDQKIRFRPDFLSVQRFAVTVMEVHSMLSGNLPSRHNLISGAF